MRNYALALLILSDIVIYLTKDLDVSSGSLSFLLTLIVVVIIAFISSALLRNAKNLKMTKNYTYSGSMGVVVGIIFYTWVKSNIAALTEWFAAHGLTFLLLINILCALIIFFTASRKKPEVEMAT